MAAQYKSEQRPRIWTSEWKAEMNDFANKYSSGSKFKLALVGSMALMLSYVFLFLEGPGRYFIALAWPGMVLCAPFGYDLLIYLLNTEQEVKRKKQEPPRYDG